MKKITLLLGAAMLFAGAANAQAPTNVYKGDVTRPVAAPSNTVPVNSEVKGASEGNFSSDYLSYSQDSYINQAGNGNNATVKQTDGRATRVNGGSSASIDQTGSNNTANQTQTLVNGSTYSVNGNAFSRSFSGATQAGTASQSDQVQTGGGFNKQVVMQGAGTTANRAIQTQSIDGSGHGAGNIATINQTNYAPAGTNSGSGNRAEQDQSGYNQNGLIDQESYKSFAKQTQRGGADGGLNGNDATIHQGAPGQANTALQIQSGVRNRARIQQGVFSGAMPPSADQNFARQTQSNQDNNADIFQGSSKNYAEQVQTGAANYSSMDQRNVSSAAYSTQSGNTNSAIVTQR